MEQHTVRIQRIEKITHDVVHITTEKPETFRFVPGQATNISMNKSGWTDNLHRFTMTSRVGDDYLEFCMKMYPEHKDFTRHLMTLQTANELILHDVFGSLVYSGPGTFIAGGAGVTPFIAIFRDLETRDLLGSNRLIVGNKTRGDIILENELHKMLGKNFINFLSQEKLPGYEHGRITRESLTTHVADFDERFYLCGPPPMVASLHKIVLELGVEDRQIIREKF